MSFSPTFRRFTWFFRIESDPQHAFLEAHEGSEDLDQEPAPKILDFKLYHKSQDYFLLVDADPALDYAALLEVLGEEAAFSRLFESLMLHGGNSSKGQPLERIYKLDQSAEYSPTEGQLNLSVGRCKRLVWTLLLEEDPELISEYKRVHGMGMAWPEITANMKSVGVKDMEIYLHESQAMLVMDTQEDFNL
ncbi:MAG: L-rhamnose mutarotase, partial [Bacteroidota bacterium]